MIPTNTIFDAELSAQLRSLVGRLELAADPYDQGMAASPFRRRKRDFDPADRTSIPALSLVRDKNGVLRWVYQPAARDQSSRRARRAARRQIGVDVIYEVDIKHTPPNKILAKISDLDDILTPNRGLRQIEHGQIGKDILDGIHEEAGPTLLLIHGTFSKSDMYTRELGATGPGKNLLASMERRYKRVLVFDHPTLSVSPWINALDLERALVNVRGEIDVVCHSRGGLLVAWWLRNGLRKVNNVIFVGSPLQGTSLASPASLRLALDYFANVATATKVTAAITSTFLPIMLVVQGLAAIVAGVLHTAASTPLADAAVVIVPGLAGQSRVSNNFEIDRLIREKWISSGTYHAVMSNFEPSAGDAAWQFWKYFQNPKEKLFSWAAGTLFENEPNDLVVNTQSMARVYRAPDLDLLIPIDSVYDFKTSTVVHHTNYFQQPETVKFLKEKLNL